MPTAGLGFYRLRLALLYGWLCRVSYAGLSDDVDSSEKHVFGNRRFAGDVQRQHAGREAEAISQRLHPAGDKDGTGKRRGAKGRHRAIMRPMSPTSYDLCTDWTTNEPAGGVPAVRASLGFFASFQLLRDGAQFDGLLHPAASATLNSGRAGLHLFAQAPARRS